MIVVHGIVLKGRFYLWAETSRSIPGRNKKKKAHPFALQSDDLLKTLLKFSNSTVISTARETSVALILPSTSCCPMPSPQLIMEKGNNAMEAVRISEWSVPALMLEPNKGAEMLISLPVDPPPGIIYGESLLFWVEVAKFNFELISRHCLIPSLERAEHDPTKGRQRKELIEARWKIFLSDEDAQRLEKLSSVMPQVCMAFADNEYEQKYDLVYDFINSSTDKFVREISAQSNLKLGKEIHGTEMLWLQSLISEDPAVEVDREKLDIFSIQMNSWLSRVNPVPADTSFRTCFRVEPPENGGTMDGKWQVTYHLQAMDDRSLLVPAKDIWKRGSSEMAFIRKHFENPQERLLEDLGRASAIFPPIEDSLKDARPASLILETEEAYTFLKEAAPLLEQSGFGILFPSWWQKQASNVGVKLKIRSKNYSTGKPGLLGVNGLVEYDWSIAVGDETFSPEEFRKLADLKMPLVNIRGKWVEIRSGEMDKAIKFFNEIHGNGEMTFGEAMRLALGREDTHTGLPITAVEADGWIGNMMRGLSNGIKFAEINAPETFNGQLRPYQVNGLSWLEFLRQTGFGACLADDMGLGKTIQLIALLLHERAVSSSTRTLIICPMSIVGNWYREIKRFGPSLNVIVHHGSDRLTGKNFEHEIKNYDVVITTYSLAARDEDVISSVEWNRIVLDEAQNIKNQDTKQSQAIRKLRSRYKVAMTGTPVENRLSELWSIMDFLNPGYLGTFAEFRKNFAIPIERFHNGERAEKLRKLIQPFLLRRLKTDPKIIRDLPEKMEMRVLCNLTREQATLYEAVVKDMVEKIERSEGIERKGIILSTLTKLKQVCNHPAQFLHDRSSFEGRSGKMARLEEMIDEAISEGDKSLIFTQFREMGEMIQKDLEEKFGTEVLFLHGGTPKKQRDLMVQRFQEDSRGPKVFILSLKAGGVGLNLTAANRVFHFDRWWNPAVENQATDRAFRIGQTRNVQVHKFVTVGTLEERIGAMIEQKKELAENIVGAGEAWLTEMSTSQLKDIFKLSREAVGE